MARRIRDANLESREGRGKLKARKKPYYRLLDRGVHLGYFKGINGGSWLLRRYLGNERYAEEKIGAADDRQDADGETILSFYQAQDASRSRVQQVAEVKRREEAGPAITVEIAVEEHLAIREAHAMGQGRSNTGVKDTRYRLERHVLKNNDLAARKLADLDAKELAEWRKSIVGLAPATVARIVADFKAALNSAAVTHRKQLPAGFSMEVKAGLRTVLASTPAAREAQVLPDADVRATIAAATDVDSAGGWGGDLYRMITMLAATGARFSQVARIKVRDVQATEHRVMVPVSRKGRGEKKTTHIAVQVGDDVLTMLKPLLAGRKGHEVLLLRPRWQQVAVGKWQPVGRGPWLNPSELSRPWGAIRTKAELSADVVPYAFRHSCIVRGLRKGLPIRLVAAMHDTSSAMIERHYSAYIVDAMEQLAADAVVPLLTAAPVPFKEISAG